MTPKKKLIEVALPLEAINAACKADKDRKVGTIRNLHKWFAPMPTPAWRALLFAAMVDDPSDPEERARLFRIIENLMASESLPPPEAALAEARQALNESGVPDDLVVSDPFCGGGSTLVEAQRFGVHTFGSDLNPVPVLITKVLTALLPLAAAETALHQRGSLRRQTGLQGVVDDVTHYAEVVLEDVRERLGAVLPATTAAWIWCRVIDCENPACARPVPLFSNSVIQKRKSMRTVFVPEVTPAGDLRFSIAEQNSEPALKSTVERSGATCPWCESPMSFGYLRSEAVAGRMTLAVAAVAEGRGKTRTYRAGTPADVATAAVSAPDADAPALVGKATQNVGLYGPRTVIDLFTPRQAFVLGTLAEAVSKVPSEVRGHGGSESRARLIADVLGLAVGKVAQSNSTLVRWFVNPGSGGGKPTPAFGRHDIPMLWDFVETSVFSESTGGWLLNVETLLRALPFVSLDAPPAEVRQADARDVARLLPPQSALVATDPPYFDQIDYAALSDYFYYWLRKALAGIEPELCATRETPKQAELVAVPYRHGGSKPAARAYFVEGFTEAFKNLLVAQNTEFPMIVVYAFKQQETDLGGGRISTGWEAMLEALIRADLAIVGTWPIWGARSARQVGISSNSLATYTAMICRPRPINAPRATRPEFLRALRAALPGAVASLREAEILPADLAQAVLGPGMSVFSSYSAVLDADGGSMSVGEALRAINHVLAEVVDEQDAELDAETRWAAAWFSQYGYGVASFGEADSLARSKVTAVDSLVKAGIVEATANRVRLLTRAELPEHYDEASDVRPTVWEALQHLLKRLESHGEVGAAELAASMSDRLAPVRDLAYRLYLDADRRAMSEEAQALTGFVASMEEIRRLAAAAPTRSLF